MSRWTKEEIDILKENYCKITVDEVNKLLPNRTYCAITARAKRLKLSSFRKITPFSLRGIHCKYSYDVKFFDIPNICNSYWAGFIATDGHMGKDGSVTIVVSTKDESVIQNFKNHTQYNGPIKVQTHHSPHYPERKFNNSRIDIWGAYKWQEKLNTVWNIPIGHKTYSLKPPIIEDKQLLYSYIIGMIDGDGFICFDGGVVCLGFCGTYEIVEWMRDIWYNISGKKATIYINSKSGLNHRIKILGKYVQNVYMELMTVNVPWKLERKWKIIKTNSPD